ncbi:MAG: NAD(P)-dependent glycerol-3-phosphate dehydrogenase [Chloroflexi bacterium]|nr:NAD(P)-dependent glycerol-3-phosphate dehydrogenase [Chloroflexota bacterium]
MSASAIRTAAVVGTTAWGTTLAVLLARNGIHVTLLARSEGEAARLQAERRNRSRLPEIEFPPQLVASADAGRLGDAQLICFVVPSQTMAANARALAAAVPAGAMLLSASKGIEHATGRRMTEVLAAALPGRPTAALSGPNLSHEVAGGLPGTTVVAVEQGSGPSTGAGSGAVVEAPVEASVEALRAAFHSATFRVYSSDDLVGVEFGGALKNIVAIAAGMVDGFGFGDNAKAAVITRGLAEISRLGVAAGADPMTFQGLAGMGDLIASSYSLRARNRRLGELIAGGLQLDAALAEIGETAEGATTIPAALGLAGRLGVEMPIAEGLHGILYGGVAPRDAVAALLDRDPKAELSSTVRAPAS